jgi:hypothetical protein
MAITMRMVARIFVFATEVTQGPKESVHYTHIKHKTKSHCAIYSGFEDTTKMSSRSRGTCPGDLAGDQTSSPATATGQDADARRTTVQCTMHCAVRGVALPPGPMYIHIPATNKQGSIVDYRR